jgi:hypothetical protein
MTNPANPKEVARDRLGGFKKLRAGRIHFRCYVCGRKMSNLPREEGDPANAVLLESPCPKHDTGKDPPMDYFDAEGNNV